MEGDEHIPPPNEEEEEEEEEWMNDDNNETGTSNRARFPSLEEELPPLPRRQEPTLKERLVERERQARVETERARLKRQFALSSNGGAASSSSDHQHHGQNGSVEGTVGEGSSVAAPPTDQGDDEEDDDDRKKLGYVMERFLRGDVKEEEEPVEKPKPEPGVLMERFLAEPVVVEQQDTAVVDNEIEDEKEQEEGDGKMPAQEDGPVDASRLHGGNNDVDGTNTTMPLPPPISATMSRDDSELEATVGSIRSYSTVTNASLAQVGTIDVLEETEEAIADDGPRSVGLSSEGDSTTYEPRVFRLTEAEIQEMAAIEEASIGNAPPSERDSTFSESSLVGDLLGDLGGDPAGDFSAGTTTTALESGSMTSVGGDDDLSDGAIEIETQSVDVIERASVSSHLVVSPGASSEGSVSITACPPSVTAGDDGDVVALPSNDEEGSAMLEMLSFEQHEHDGTNASLECAPSFEDGGGLLDVEAAAAANAGIANRQSRQGRMPRSSDDAPETPGDESDKGKKNVHIMLEGFDYDRSAQDPLEHTPHSRTMDSYNELPGDDPWSPAVATGAMNLSPLQPESTFAASRAQAAPGYPDLERDVANGNGAKGAEGAQASAATYGSVEVSTPPKDLRLGLLRRSKEAHQNETLPLVGNRDIEEEMDHEDRHLLRDDLKHAMSNVFSSLRSDSTGTVEEINTDSEEYLALSIFKRAFPERYFALCLTLLFEIPVLLMVSGGSDRLCMLIGRRRYQLMMGFLPLSSAISGNVGLQASTLTTRAVSHDHVTKSSYLGWLAKEVAAAAFLGIGMGCVIGSYAYFISGMDYAFGLTIFMAQFVSIITAGLTGTLAPLMFTFIFHRDAAMYGGPLETAIQDIVGSFAMVIMSYHLLVFFGPMEISPDDICGQQ